MNDGLTRPKPATMFQFRSVDDAFHVADIVAKSTLCPKDYRGRPGDIIVAWQLGAEVGLEPMQALAGIAVINGRASLWGDAFLAVAMSHPSFVSIQEMSFSEIKVKQEATCIVIRKNRHPVERTFSVADAQRAQLWGKPGPWKQYPERMLQMRARGFAIRDVFPDALIGMVSAEEAHDHGPLEPQSDGTMKLTTGTHKFGFASKPTQAPAPEHSSDSSTYLGLIDMISAATDEESLAACQPRGSIGEEERARAKQAWVSRKGEIEEEKERENTVAIRAKPKLKAKPETNGNPNVAFGVLPKPTGRLATAPKTLDEPGGGKAIVEAISESIPNGAPQPVGPAAEVRKAPVFVAPPLKAPEEDPWTKHLPGNAVEETGAETKEDADQAAAERKLFDSKG